MHLRKTFVSLIQPYSSFEPAYFIFYLAQGFADFAEINLYLQKTCRNQTQFEPNLSTPCDSEKKGIEFVASLYSRYALWLGVMTVIMLVLLSAWCDKAPNRPKSCVLILMFLRLLQLINLCLQSYFWHWNVYAVVLTEFLLHVASCVRLTAKIYICCTSSTEDRTIRLTLLYVLHTLASLISTGSSGYVLHHLGFFYTFVLSLVLHIISFIYAAIFMKRLSSEDANQPTRGYIKSVREFFDVRSVIQAFRLVYGKRIGNERITIILLTAVSVLSFISVIGENSVLYLYLRYKFAWNEKDYGIYGLYKMAGVIVGSMICLGVSKYLKVPDSALGMFAAFWDTLASLGYFFAQENWQLYLVPLFDIFHGFALNVCVSTQSKFFKNEELGRLFSAHVAVSIFVTFAIPLYNFLFKKTMDFAPASLFILSASINIIICILYGICYLLIKKMPKKD